MTKILFDPFAIFLSSILILNLAVFGYLLSVRAKSVATRWLTAFFGALALFNLGQLGWSSFYIQPVPLWTWYLFGGTFIALGLSFLAYLQFAFQFLENPFPREAKIALGTTGLLWLVMSGLIGIVPLFSSPLSASQRVLPFSFLIFLGMFLWTPVVLLRKWRFSARAAPSGPDAHRKRAFRAFTLINGLLIVYMLAMLILNVLINALGSLPDGVFYFLSVSGNLAYLGFVAGIALVYLNYAPEPTSFQAKLVGMSLVGVLALAGVLGVVLPSFQEAAFSTEAPQQQALRFTPGTPGHGGYEAAALAYQYESDLGEDLHLSDDSARVRTLGFSFPFYGKSWDRLYISPNGAVSFGEPLYRDGDVKDISGGYFYNDLPKIAPLYTFLDPSAGGGVFFKQAEDRVVITWHEVPLVSRQRLVDMQLVLYRSGAIDLVYNRMDGPLRRASWGLVPGATAPSSASLLDDLPYTIAPGEARTEDHELVYRQRAHEAVLPLFWLMLGATALVAGVFPWVYRSSLVQPLARVLRGVQRVNAGDLTTEVSVGARDEIGRLTHYFNQMTRSLQQYNGEMEALVAERTAALEASLAELKTTQARLVQQEKMASLGQLTAGIAHEIKNPLNFVNNFAEVNEELADELRAELDASTGKTVDDVRKDLDMILADLTQNAQVIAQHGKRADAIVHAMMQHASGGKGQRETVEINQLITEHIDLAYHGKRAQVPDLNVEIKRELDEDAGHVEIVPQEIGRVLLNLLGNAFDAVHEAGVAAPTVTISTQRVNGQVAIRVSDNGLGIPEEIKEKIFEPFFTTKPTGSGTGLGLSLSYDIVTQGHGGTLTVESEEDRGASFIVTLPVNQTESDSIT